MAMMLRILSIALLAACSASANPSRIVQEFHFAKEHDSDLALQRAAFGFLKGRSRQDALDFLIADGFACAEAVCTYRIVDRERFAERAFGIGPPRGAMSRAEFRRNIVRSFEIRILRERVEDMTAIEADFELLRGS
ncbi:MAG: hypothetical protein QNJ16_13875 [Rhodobacter sp.]|nr:hypothetical protein [Rhodobacter sp.]